jgi:hypothetical protein
MKKPAALLIRDREIVQDSRSADFAFAQSPASYEIRVNSPCPTD